MDDFSKIHEVEVGSYSRIYPQVNLYRCKIGDHTKIDSFVYIEEGVEIGNYCKIRPFTFIPTGVVIGDHVFVGPNVTFTNDKYPHTEGEWKLEKTEIHDRVSIGAGSVICPGVTIGEGAMIGAGSVVTKDIPPGVIAYGNPARVMSEKNT